MCVIFVLWNVCLTAVFPAPPLLMIRRRKEKKTHPKVVHSQFQNQSPVFINRVRRRGLFEYKIFN